jgi:hypothetical protein
MTLLVNTYRQQKKWTEAQAILHEKIALGSRNTTGDNSDVLSDTIALVEILLAKMALAEALLYARRALKGYRRMGVSGTAGVEKALQLLIWICHAQGNLDEEEAYTAMLSDFIERKRRASRSLLKRKPLPDSQRPSTKGKFNALEYVKGFITPITETWKTNGGLRPAVKVRDPAKVPSIWRFMLDDERPESTMHLTYTRLFEMAAFPKQTIPPPENTKWIFPRRKRGECD